MRIATVVLLVSCTVACEEETVTAYGGMRASRGAPELANPEFDWGGLVATFTTAPVVEGEWTGDCRLTAWGGALMDAGRVTYTIGDSEFTHMFDYDSIRIDAGLLEPGTEITMSAEGAEVPSCEATIEFPDHLSGIVMPGSDDEVSLGEDLHISWTPSQRPLPPETERYVSFVISTGGVAIACRTDDSDGTGTIPHELLGELFPGDHLISIQRIHERRTGVSEVIVQAATVANTEPAFVDGVSAQAWNGGQR